MKVSELIVVLKEMDPDAMVLVGSDGVLANEVVDSLKGTVTMVDKHNTKYKVIVLYCEMEIFWELDEENDDEN